MVAEYFLGETLLRMKRYDEAKQVLVASMSQWERINGVPWRIARSRGALGEVLYRQGQVREGENYIVDAYRVLYGTVGSSVTTMHIARDRLTRLYTEGRKALVLLFSAILMSGSLDKHDKRIKRELDSVPLASFVRDANAVRQAALPSALRDFVQFFFAHHVNRHFHQVAHHGFDVAPDVTDLRVLRSFHLHERAAGQARQAPRDFRLTNAGGANHQDIFRQNIFGNFRRQLLPAYTIAQSHGHSPLCRILADNIFVQFRHDFPRRHIVKGRQKFFALRRAAIRVCAAGHQNQFFVRLAWHIKVIGDQRPVISKRPSGRLITNTDSWR